MSKRYPFLLLVFVVIVWIPPSLGQAQDGYVTVDADPPQWSYTGDTNSSSIEWETGGSFSASWLAEDDSPHWALIYYNATGVNSTYSSASYTDGETLSAAYDPGLSLVGQTVFFQLKLNDTFARTNSSIVYFSVVNTASPSVTINRPENSTYTGGEIEVWLACTNADLDKLWWALYYSNATLREGNVTWTETVTRTLPDGGYYLKGYANDTAGLEGTNTVYFTLIAGAMVGGSGGTPTTTPPDYATIPPPEIPRIQFKIPGLFIVLCVGGVIYGVHRYVPEEAITPPEEFIEYKRALKKDLVRTYYQLQNEKRPARRKKP